MRQFHWWEPAEEKRNGPAGRASAAGRQRRRIERDLHDGAQQHVPALRLELMLSPPSPAGAALVEHVEEALEALQNVP